jgi:dTDP-4-amino-4,6-dideoxygalactose transaminase
MTLDEKKTTIHLVRPTLVPWEEVALHFEKVWESGNLTVGEYTREFEDAVCEVTEATYAIAVSSCTSGLMLLLRALDITGEVILPAFTWTSTGHALVWNQIKPVFADCIPDTFTLDPEDVKRKITEQTEAIFAANVFGVQPDMDALQAVADKAGVKLLCDSAQAIGSKYKGRPAGSTTYAEVFSLSPTKVVTAVEGGLITTNDGVLADKLRRMRDYGKTVDGKDVEFFGLSARISEMHSIVGTANLKHCREMIDARKRLAQVYLEGLEGVGDLEFQTIPEGYDSSYNYFVVFTNWRNGLESALSEKGIQTKRYFNPPLHKQLSYLGLDLPKVKLPVTENACNRALALPFYSHLEPRSVDTVIHAVRNFFG